MRKLIIEQDILVTRGNATISDESGEVVYTIRKSSGQEPVYEICQADSGIAKIIQEGSKFHPVYTIYVDDASVGSIKVGSTHDQEYIIECKNLRIAGNCWGDEFEMFYDDVLAGKISKESAATSYQYVIEICDSVKEKFVIAVVVAIDCVKSTRRGI